MKRSSRAAVAVLCLSAAGAPWAPVQAAEITIMGYRGAFEQNYVKAVIEPFMKAHPDISVVYAGVQNAAAALGNLRAQRAHRRPMPSSSTCRSLRSPAMRGCWPSWTLPAFPPMAIWRIWAGPGRRGDSADIRHADPYLRPRRLRRSAHQLERLLGSEAARQVTIPAQGGGDIQAILLTIIANRMAGERDYKKTIQPGVDKLVKLAPAVQTWEPKPDAYTLVANGTSTLSIGYNARSQYYYDQTEGRLRSISPKEGSASQINVIGAIANAAEPAATLAFIQYAISPEAQESFARTMFYAPTNTRAEVDEATRARIPMMDPEQRARLIPVDWMSIGDMRESMLRPWRRQIIPASR